MRICWSEEKALYFVPILQAKPWAPKELSFLRRMIALVKRLLDPYNQPIVARVAIDQDSPLLLVGYSNRYRSLYEGYRPIGVPRDALHIQLKNIRLIDPCIGGPLFLKWIEQIFNLCLFWRKPFDASKEIGLLPSTILGFGSEGKALNFSLKGRKITLIFEQGEAGATCQDVLKRIVRKAKLEFIPRSKEEFKEKWKTLRFEQRADWFSEQEYRELFRQEARAKPFEEVARASSSKMRAPLPMVYEQDYYF